MTTEDIAGRLATFHEQFHMIHWETRSFAEHKATGGSMSSYKTLRMRLLKR